MSIDTIFEHVDEKNAEAFRIAVREELKARMGDAIEEMRSTYREEVSDITEKKSYKEEDEMDDDEEDDMDDDEEDDMEDSSEKTKE